MGALSEVCGDEKNGEGSRTFVFDGEGHTLGNALKMIISRYPDVNFCGYTIPHPTENRMNFRIQAREGHAIDILQRGLKDLEGICDVTLEKFQAELENFNSNN